jgi:hypothetical protein
MLVGHGAEIEVPVLRISLAAEELHAVEAPPVGPAQPSAAGSLARWAAWPYGGLVACGTRDPITSLIGRGAVALDP